MKKNHVVLLMVCCVLMLGGAAGAETYELSGASTWNPESVSTMTLPDGRILTRQTLRGTAIADDPNTPLSMASQDCMFTTVTAADGKSFNTGGSCDGVDKDGDVYWAVGTASEEGGTWRYIGGTGKFEGLEGGGTYQLALEWPDGKVMATWDGKATMK